QELTRDEANQSLLSMLDGVGFPATSFQEGSIPLGLVELGAEIWSKLSAAAVFLKELGLNQTASGDGLTRFSKSHYANERVGAVAAQRVVTLFCAAGEGPHTIDLSKVVIADPTGRTFRNVEGFGAVYPATLAALH